MVDHLLDLLRCHLLGMLRSFNDIGAKGLDVGGKLILGGMVGKGPGRGRTALTISAWSFSLMSELDLLPRLGLEDFSIASHKRDELEGNVTERCKGPCDGPGVGFIDEVDR